MEVIDSKSKALEIYMMMVVKNEHLSFNDRMRKSKLYSIKYAKDKLKECKLYQDRLYWEVVITQIEQIP